MGNVTGTFTPLATPFTDDGRALSEVRLVRQVRYWLEQGATGFYLGGESGEFLTVSTAERKSCLEIVQRECQSAIPIIVNVSSIGTALTLDIAQHAGRHGASAAFLAPPYFGRYTDAEQIKHLRAVIGLAGLPILIADLFGSIKSGFGDAFDTLPQVECAKGNAFDEWETETASVHALAALMHLFPEVSTPILAAAYVSRGPAVLIKAAFERVGVDLGGTRAPKTALDARELTEMLTSAA